MSARDVYRYDMGVMAVGPTSARGIRFLVLVLALTASRNNFPLIKSTLPCPTRESTTLQHRPAKNIAKYDGVVPSRRLLESRRTDWMQGHGSDLDPQPARPDLLARPESALRLAGLPGGRITDLCVALARPEYLNLFRQATTSTSLPPPA